MPGFSISAFFFGAAIVAIASFAGSGIRACHTLSALKQERAAQDLDRLENIMSSLISKCADRGDRIGKPYHCRQYLVRLEV